MSGAPTSGVNEGKHKAKTLCRRVTSLGGSRRMLTSGRAPSDLPYLAEPVVQGLQCPLGCLPGHAAESMGDACGDGARGICVLPTARATVCTVSSAEGHFDPEDSDKRGKPVLLMHLNSWMEAIISPVMVQIIATHFMDVRMPYISGHVPPPIFRKKATGEWGRTRSPAKYARNPPRKKAKAGPSPSPHPLTSEICARASSPGACFSLAGPSSWGFPRRGPRGPLSASQGDRDKNWVFVPSLPPEPTRSYHAMGTLI